MIYEHDRDVEGENHIKPLDHADHNEYGRDSNMNSGTAGRQSPLENMPHKASSMSLPPFGGEFQPGPYKPSFRQFANPAPLGLCAFALTTFILSLINANTRGVENPSIVVGAAFAYGGFVQILSGMWEMAVGNTFGATALTSYGGFWISWAMIETKAFGIASAYDSDPLELHNALGYYLLGWFIFTTLLLFCTMKSTVAFCSLFFFLDITFLLLAISHLNLVDGQVNGPVKQAAGIFGLICAFVAWWNAFAGLSDHANSFFTLPVVHFPWSQRQMEAPNSWAFIHRAPTKKERQA
ncbi:GPR/FUN34 family protein [Peziza echinospora]|nr:GPR/FUN34 family protein [Peziza echinospora]